ncbi:SusC/RagA family TonB-linked outer membrane protein [Sphingobacterium sp. FBM7-1]|uniref:SusC/RagA family TonB-linked outer membrane protein n=1 Tax=Sphingobacterium sp. FBM7-1 TaxID=2886688 RepID=UPI001D124FB4|nr:TonB-dependent receptor [Sphingobacterium sp. FBM7-1]MCC2599910.1 TonB-dependent receptor [Sphingobacterium sp. FBM7-1]
MKTRIRKIQDAGSYLLVLSQILSLCLVLCIPSIIHASTDDFDKLFRSNTYEVHVGSLQDKVIQKLVSGTVRDSLGNGLEGVSITVQGTSRGTSSDRDGRFEIEAAVGEVLIFNNVGYRPSMIAVGAQQNIEVILQAAESDLEEVVVVGFGTQKKASVTGAIASIQTREIKQSPAANLAVSLAGRLPGLTAIQRSGEPGRDLTELFIRGQGTVNAQSPIVLVDGIERPLTSIDPNEVESVTILKDASSTAIFGVRGANGVILVTTRRGVSEIPEIVYSLENSAQDFPRLIKPVNAYQFATLRNQAHANDGLPPAYSDYALERYLLQDDPKRYPDNNWNEINLRKYALMQRHNLNVSGAGKMSRYFVNAGYLRQGGQFKTEHGQPMGYDPSFKLDRYNFRSNIDLNLNKRLTAFLNVAGYVENVNSPWGATGADPSLYIIAYGNDMPANVPGPLTEDGEILVGSAGQWSQFALINRSGYLKTTRGNIMATYGMEQSLDFITEGLTTRAVVSFDINPTNTLSASRGYESWMQVIDPNLTGQDGRDSVYYVPSNAGVNTPLSIGGSRTFTSLSNFQAFLNYNRTFNDHSLAGMLLFQQQKTIINTDLPYNLRGLSSRFTYTYKNRYTAEFNAGYNGSEQFAKGNRYGFFPAISAAWIVSDEEFFDVSFMNLLKLRSSYGLVGNDRIGGGRFLYLDNVQLGGGGYSGSLGLGQVVNTILFKNDKLKWEVARKTNLGIEVGLFNSVNLVVDLYKEKRDNILRYRGTIPILNGLPTEVLAPVNIGVIENKGYEIELNYNKRFNNDLSVLSKINVNYARNRQVFADEAMRPEDYAYRYRQTGYRIGQQFGWLVDGYFESEEDVALAPIQSVGGRPSKPGDFRYKDLNGDGVVDERDMAPILYSPVPEYTFGAAFNVMYKRFDLSVLLQGVTNVSSYYMFRGTNSVANYVDRHLESWTEERHAAGLPIRYPRLTTQANPNETMNDFFINDASYIRLKNMELGYNLSEGIADKLRIKGARFYVNGLNLITWDRLPTKNFDPELVGDLSYPNVRIYNLGVNVRF